MSIMNVFVSPDVALVGVDTEGTLPSGEVIEGGKVILLPHINAVVAFRGLDSVLACAAPWIVCFRGGFDDLTREMGKITHSSLGYCKERVNECGIDREGADVANFALVGYSPKSGRMLGHAYHNNPGSLDVDEEHDFPQLIAPCFGIDEIKKLNIVADKDGMRLLALDQCRLVRERGPSDSPAGGRLFITEIRKDRISTEYVCHFPTRPRNRSAAM